jgi:hypothetical protein
MSELNCSTMSFIIKEETDIMFCLLSYSFIPKDQEIANKFKIRRPTMCCYSSNMQKILRPVVEAMAAPH